MSDTQDTAQDTNEHTDMQTVLANYGPADIIAQTDIDVNYPNEYTEYQRSEDACSGDDKINVDDGDLENDDKLEDSIDVVNEVDDSIESDFGNCRSENAFELSWHPHVYGKPPKMPTPHTIEHILGLNRIKEDSKKAVSQLMSVKRNFEKFSEKSEVQRDLERKAHKNRLQEQILQRGVRNSESEVQYGHKSDEPLNLSVPKTKDGWSGDEDKFRDVPKTIKRKKSTDDVRSPLGGEGSMTSEEGEDSAVGRRKKARTTFTGRQIFELEKLFEVKKYLSSGERADMAKLLNVTETQ
ncbi:unnamed protein product, partial [Leptidea sinapis]